MAFLSDLHGNLEALEAVLAELEHAGVKDVYVAGDLLYGGGSPLQVWQRLQAVGARCTRGLSDVALATVDPDSLSPADEHERARAQEFAETRRALGDLVVERLKRLPQTLRIPMVDGREIVMVHGSPHDPSEEMSHEMTEDELLELMGDDPADIVVCGASHVPFHRTIDSLQIVNVGAVGAAPEGRFAHYTVITPRLEGALVDQRWVEY